MTLEEIEALQIVEMNKMWDNATGSEGEVEKPPIEVVPVLPEVAPDKANAQTAPTVDDLPVEIKGADVTQPVTEVLPDAPSIEDMLRAQLQELTARLNAPVQQVYPAAVPAVEAKPAEQAIATPTTVPVVTQDAFVPGTYLTDDELDRVLDDPKLIVKAIKRAQADVMKQMTSQLGGYQQTINQQVQQAVQQQIMVTKAITDFYDANQDLRKYAQFTQYVLAEVEGKYVGSATPKTYADIFDETAKEARKRLGLPNPEVQTIERGRVVDQKPAFAGSKKGGNARPQETKEIFDKNAQDIIDMAFRN